MTVASSDFELLAKPFEMDQIKQRIMVSARDKLSAMPANYIDARDVMDRLDSVLGPENWQKDYKEIKGVLFAGIGIYVDGQWVWKWDAGTESDTEKEKGEASDSFKRAAVNWGIGRFLYNLPDKWISVDVYTLANGDIKQKGFNEDSLRKYRAWLADYMKISR